MKSIKAVALAAMTSCSFLPAMALAQAQDDVADDNDNNVIVITANQREQSLQEVPIAVSAFNETSLTNAGVTDVTGLTAVAPSISFTNAQSSSSTTSIRIRGIGTLGNNAGFESAVGVFIDGVYQSRPGIALGEMFDVEQVEVLRGPQGTLFGRNTSVGALTIRTKAPELGKFGGKVSASYGNFDMINLQGAINVPAGDVLALRFSGSYRKRDGWVTLADGSDGNGFERYVVRGQALWEPTPDVTLRLIADYQDSDSECCHPVTLSETLFAPFFGLSGTVPIAVTGDRALDNNITGSQFKSDKTNQWGITGELNWSFGDTTLTYLGSYRDFSSELIGDTDFQPQAILNDRSNPPTGQDIEFMSHEFRLQGKAFEGRLDWLIGAYYSDESIRAIESRTLGSGYINILNNNFFGVLAGPPVGNPLAFGNNPSGFFTTGMMNVAGIDPAGAFATNLYNQDAKSFSIFTHNIFEITEGLFLTVGARYVDEKKTGSLQSLGGANNACLAALGNITNNPLFFNGTPADPSDDGPFAGLGGLGIGLHCLGFATPLDVGPNLPASFNTVFKDDEFVYTGNLRYEFSPDVSAYVSYTHGFKSGGVNADSTAGVNGADPRFISEKVDSLEFGLKASLFDGDVNANLAIYNMDIDNFQLLSFTGVAFNVFNVPKSRSRGVEFDAQGRVSENLSLNLAVSYTDASFPNDCAPTTAVVAVTENCGLDFVNAPELVVVAGGNFRHEIGASGVELSVIPSLRYESSSLTSSASLLNANGNSFTFDMRVGISDIDSNWGLEFWGKNIFDERVIARSFSIPFRGLGGASAKGAFYREPATYGVTVRGKF